MRLTFPLYSTYKGCGIFFPWIETKIVMPVTCTLFQGGLSVRDPLHAETWPVHFTNPGSTPVDLWWEWHLFVREYMKVYPMQNKEHGQYRKVIMIVLNRSWQIFAKPSKRRKSLMWLKMVLNSWFSFFYIPKSVITGKSYIPGLQDTTVTGQWTLCFLYSGQALYQLNHIPQP